MSFRFRTKIVLLLLLCALLFGLTLLVSAIDTLGNEAINTFKLADKTLRGCLKIQIISTNG